jgi:hypothetical protein
MSSLDVHNVTKRSAEKKLIFNFFDILGQKSVSQFTLRKTDVLRYIYSTAVGLTPGGSSTQHIYTQTVHIIQRKENWGVRAVPRLCELHPGICLTTEEKARENADTHIPFF